MHISTMAFALALALPASVPAGPAVRSSPLGSAPAVIRYVSNDAPFVVFDVSPRSVTGPLGDLREITLNFIATDALRQLNVFAYVTSARDGSTQSAAGTACGAFEPGSWRCTIPARALLERMDRGEGLLGLRIEAQGLERDRSTVVITLPVASSAARPARLPPQ
jgi:hypothetical protein